MPEANMQLEESELLAARNKRFPYLKFGSELEHAYQEYRHQRLLGRVTVIGKAALVLFLFFAVVDRVTLPEPAYLICIAIRLLFNCPMILMLMYGPMQRASSKVYRACYALAYLLTGFSIIAIIYTARIHGSPMPYDGLMLLLVFGYFVMGMPFAQSVLTSLSISFVYFMVELILIEPSEGFAANAMFMLLINGIGTFGCYLQERSKRLLFLNMRLLEMANEKNEQEVLSKTRLLATASHDLRQPLHAMNLLIAALQKQALNETAQTMAKQLKASTRQLSQLLSSILNISRLNAGIVEAKIQNYDLAPLMHSMANDQKIRAQETGLNIHVEGVAPCFVMTDPVLLERIIRNLCENIFEHAQACTLSICWSSSNDKVHLEISDDGCGIQAEDQERIFEAFQQSGNTKHHGMGLGLAIVRQLSELLNMPLSFESKLGHGSRTQLTLPSSQPSLGTSPSLEATAIDTKQNAHIMVIDDDESILKSTKVLLEEWAYKVTTCVSPEQALREIELCMPDLLLCDYRFKNSTLNGIELTKSLRLKLARQIPTIVISADTDGDLKHALANQLIEQEKNITSLAYKPLMPARLRLMIQHYLNTEDG